MRHFIDIRAHIKSMWKLKRRLEEGFYFVPKDVGKWEAALIHAGFQHDLREKHLGFIPSVGALAALATTGQGYRERGSPSLHCAVARDMCNVHLDNIGFRFNGYSPDAGQHIVDELLWQDNVVPFLGKIFSLSGLSKLVPISVTDVFHRAHPLVPNSGQSKPFREMGAEFDIASGRSRDLQQQWRFTFDVTHSCSDYTCGVWRTLNGKSVEGENKVMFMFKVVGM
jgi:hypothetical protein